MRESMVRWEGSTMDDKLCALAVARRLHAEGVWCSYGDDAEEIYIKRPTAVWEKMSRYGFTPVNGANFLKGPVGTFAANAPVFYEDEPDDEESDDEDGAPVSVPSAPDTVKFIETEVFGGAVRAYIEDVIEVNLPEWSGRMDRAYALAELARLKAFVVQVEQAVSGALGTDTPPVEQSVPPQRDTDNVPSERAQVVEDAVREDEAADDDKSLSELHDEYVRHWDDWKDSGDYGYGPEDNPFQSWLKINYPKAYRRSMVIDQRRIMRFRREIARERGARPYTVVFELAHGVRFFDGEVYRVISPADFSSDDIPF